VIKSRNLVDNCITLVDLRDGISSVSSPSSYIWGFSSFVFLEVSFSSSSLLVLEFISNSKNDYFIHLFSYHKVWYPPLSFNKVISESGSVDQERPVMAKKKKKKKKKISEKYEEKKRNPKKKETLEQTLQTKASIKDEKVLYSQKIWGRGRGRGSRGNDHSGRGRGQEGYYEENEQSSQQNKTLKEARSKDKAALYMLFWAVDESDFEKIIGATTSKEPWDILEKVFKRADRVKQVRLQTLRGELESMKMKESKSVSDYITRVKAVVNQLIRNGEALTNARVVEKILRSLTDNFENVVCAIKELKDLAKLTVDELAGSLEAHEQCKRKKRKTCQSWELCIKQRMLQKCGEVFASGLRRIGEWSRHE
jgi:gag-polypeptide of LTR copia-type